MATAGISEVSLEERNIIGISFGNSNSSIAYTTSEDKAEVIANEDGDRQIPTILSYVDGEEYNGQQAKQQLIRNSENTVAYFRDFLGQDFKSIDPTHCHASAHPLEHESTIAFKIKDKSDDDESIVTVTEIVSRQIRRLAQSASDYIGKQVNSAVITVPTNFSDKQKEALVKAASDAGIEVLQLIHEPVAALLAYDARPGTESKDKIVLVADLGGTRSDVAVIASRAGLYTILATVHDYDFAGVHLDQVLQDHFAKEFIKWNGADADPRKNARSMAKLKLESEATKRSLSIGTNASFSVESLNIGVDFSSTINRLRYETIARKVFEGFNRLAIRAVEKAGLDLMEIDEVILSGGTSHTPKIASNMRNIFTSPNTVILAPSTSPTSINPSELQARGAALQANLIHDYEKEDIAQSTHDAVTSAKHLSKAMGVLSISDDCEKGIFTPIIAAESAAPVRKSIQIATPREGGDVLIKIVEAETIIKVSKAEPKPKLSENEDSEEDSDSETEEEIREKVWKVGVVLSEAVIKDVKKGGKIEITLNVDSDLAMAMTFREFGSKAGVRGCISVP